MSTIIKRIFAATFPSTVDNTIRGKKLPYYMFAFFAVVSAVRSCIHTFAPDGGAGSIAGMNLAVAGADGIIFAFALWGSSQLLFAFIQLLVAFRYRSLVPMMYLMLIAEVLLRKLVYFMKPVTFAHTPPGAVANQVLLPLAALMFVLSLWSVFKPDERAR